MDPRSRRSRTPRARNLARSGQPAARSLRPRQPLPPRRPSLRRHAETPPQTWCSAPFGSRNRPFLRGNARLRKGSPIPRISRELQPQARRPPPPPPPTARIGRNDAPFRPRPPPPTHPPRQTRHRTHLGPPPVVGLVA